MASALPLRRCWAEIDLAALQHNLAAVRAQVGDGVRVMAVVKANAYGHDVRHVVPALAGRVEMFGVANVAEAREVRALAAETPVFLLGPALPEERAEIVAAGFVPSVSSATEAREFGALAGGRRVPVHLVIDTGMGRIGVWQEEAAAVAREILALPSLEITGIASHFPSADEDAAFTREQIAHFQGVVAELKLAGLSRPLVHLENSAGVIGFPAAGGDMVRPGLMLYGSAPVPDFQPRLRAVMSWKTRVTLVREVGAGRGISYGRAFIAPHPMRVATLATGYADGYRRHLSGREASVLLRGQRCAVLGRVTMDQIVADVSALPGIECGEECVLLGRQGREEILAAELAQKAGTIPWEIFTGIGRRVERVKMTNGE